MLFCRGGRGFEPNAKDHAVDSLQNAKPTLSMLQGQLPIEISHCDFSENFNFSEKMARLARL